jgi:hypothetical protein
VDAPLPGQLGQGLAHGESVDAGLLGEFGLGGQAGAGFDDLVEPVCHEAGQWR